jgi:Sulfate permease and related transporters (MFS superfamily)
VDVPQNLLNAIRLPAWAALANLRHGNFIAAALGMAFVASAETLLSAAAVDRIHNGQRTNFDQELSAQGIGNFLCGIVGALPMTGVIVRSSANVQAGAKTRASAVLHGLWLLAFVVALPSVLRMVPTASLAGVLVLTGLN